MVHAEARVDQEIRFLSFFRIRDLFVQDRLERLFRHARPGQDAGTLDLGRGGDDDDLVEPAIRAGLEQKRDVAEHQGVAFGPGIGQEAVAIRGDQRMNRGLDAAEQIRVGQDGGAQSAAIDAVVGDRVGGEGGDGRGAGAAGRVEPVDGGVRIPNRHAERGEHGRRGRLAHADRAGEAEHDHRPAPGRAVHAPAGRARAQVTPGPRDRRRAARRSPPPRARTSARSPAAPDAAAYRARRPPPGRGRPRRPEAA